MNAFLKTYFPLFAFRRLTKNVSIFLFYPFLKLKFKSWDHTSHRIRIQGLTDSRHLCWQYRWTDLRSSVLQCISITNTNFEKMNYLNSNATRLMISTEHLERSFQRSSLVLREFFWNYKDNFSAKLVLERYKVERTTVLTVSSACELDKTCDDLTSDSFSSAHAFCWRSRSA